MILGLCTLAAVVLVTGVMAIPARSTPGVKGSRARRRRAGSEPSTAGRRPPRATRVVVRRRWVRRLGVEQTVLRLQLDPRSAKPAPTRSGPAPGETDDLDLSDFDRLPPILGPARLSELRPQVAEWRW